MINRLVIKVKFNSMKKNSFFIILIFLPTFLFSQETLKGMIMDKNNPKDNLGVFGANVFWLNTTVGATTDEKGWFQIPYKKNYKKLVVSYVGYKTDTLVITDLEPINHFITLENELEEVTLKSKKKATQRSFIQTQNVFTVNSEELLKAACCNLAESFETNPSIDVNFSDALTGTRQIQMLRLKESLSTYYTRKYSINTRRWTGIWSHFYPRNMGRKYSNHQRCRECYKWLREYFRAN